MLEIVEGNMGCLNSLSMRQKKVAPGRQPKGSQKNDQLTGFTCTHCLTFLSQHVKSFSVISRYYPDINLIYATIKLRMGLV